MTGFGLCGHLHELAAASGVAAVLDARGAPLAPAACASWPRRARWPGGEPPQPRGRAEYATFAGGLDELDRVLACDAQTSGGLLVALPPGRAETFRRACAARDVPAARIGRLAEGPAGSVLVS